MSSHLVLRLLLSDSGLNVSTASRKTAALILTRRRSPPPVNVWQVCVRATVLVRARVRRARAISLLDRTLHAHLSRGSLAVLLLVSRRNCESGRHAAAPSVGGG